MSEPPTPDALGVLAEKVVARARQGGFTFVAAESCTGGLVGHLVTEVPGASAVFHGGWVAYADRRKIEDLGVHADLIERHGAVSKQVAETMAQGARKRAGTTFAVATTGIAGPAGGTKDKPVGTLWCAVAAEGQVDTQRVLVTGVGRTETKRAFADAALRALHAAMER